VRAWAVDRPGRVGASAAGGGPLRLVDRDRPTPGPGEVLVRVSVCGVCRTDLHLAEGDLAPRRPGVVPGHEVVGTVESVGEGTHRLVPGQRVGIAWLRHTCGVCARCRRGAENLCADSRYTGWDVDGGFAEYAVVPEAFAYRLPRGWADERCAPLLCAGIIGYRSLRRAQLPPGGRLGIYGFGASAHLAAQVAMHEGATVHVLTRSEAARRHALALGCASAGAADDAPPEPLDGAILFAPAGELVPTALAALDRGGTLAVAGIHLTDVPALRYQEHLFQERQLRSVTSNTRADGEEFLRLAEAMDLTVTTTPYAFGDTDRALADLSADRVEGAAVVRVHG
jgi:propanol-preferring alcohol dehydrogenase